MVEIKLISKQPFIFNIEGANYSIANAIRRASYDIPILAIDKVEFIKNDSALFDEILAHRLGLLPLKSEKNFVLQEECSCKGKGCAKCQAALTLKAKGPCTVYSSELKGRTAKPAYKMPLVILEKDQELEIIAYAKVGFARNHAKFSSCLVAYREMPEIKIKSCSMCEACIKACPKKILVKEEKKIILKNIYECDMCEACIEACKENSISLEKKENNFIFEIESYGQLDEREIFSECVKTLNRMLKQAEKDVEKAK